MSFLLRRDGEISDVNVDRLKQIHKHAACIGLPSKWFFPETKRGGISVKPGSDIYNAFTTCEGCEVRQTCYDFAIENGVVGVWGGRIFRYGRPTNTRIRIAKQKKEKKKK